jgi:hypothetical protein
LNALEEANSVLDAMDLPGSPQFSPDQTVAIHPMIPAHAEVIGGAQYWRDTKNRLVPVETIDTVDQLMDETVRKIVGYAVELAAQVRRYKIHTTDDILALQAVLAQEHNTPIGGAKGNVTLTSFDGLMKVSVKIADVTIYGPEMQLAKSKVDECLRGWAEGTVAELRAIVENAFQTDKEGHFNRANLLALRRVRSDNPTWQEAMALIVKAERPMGTKEYVQVHRRAHVGAAWEHVAIDLAAA